MKQIYYSILDIWHWYKRSFESPFPFKLKINTLKKYGLAPVWVETGTHVGRTCLELSKNYKEIFSIEPDSELFKISTQNCLHKSNIKIFFGTSEILLEKIIIDLIKFNYDQINFWLDGHYSGDGTYKNTTDTPILTELQIIDKYLNKLSRFSILIDDVRCFRFNSGEYSSYPDLKILVNWCNARNLKFMIENDIFIITNYF